jgi:hypothetical protein
MPRENLNESARFFSLLVTLLWAVLCTACKIEEELDISADGSGIYRARISVEKQFAEAIGDLKSRVTEKKGFRVSGEGETQGSKYIDVVKEFKSISELNDDEDSYSLESTRETLFTGKYSLVMNIRSNPSASNFERRITVTLPASVAYASAGEVLGRSVKLDCSRPGTLEVHAAGFSIPVTTTQKRVAGAAVAAAALALVLVRLRRRPRRPTCVNCGAKLASDTRFCAKCGKPHVPAEPRA